MSQLKMRLFDPDSPRDLQALQELFEAAPRYSINISGAVPTPDAAREALDELPPVFKRDCKHLMGVEEDGHLVGCVDLLRGFPAESTAMLGLLLLREDCQGRGLGRRCFELIESYVRQWPEVRRIRIGVVEGNIEVLPFWEKLGFRDNGQRRPHEQGQVSSCFRVLEKPL